MAECVRADDAWYRSRLAPPQGRVRLVIDTDAANEIDDQFALAWAMLSPQRLEVLALYAAPFSFAHRRQAWPLARADAAPFDPPGIGMERSYHEILRVLDRLGLRAAPPVLRGSAGYLRAPDLPQRSAAVEHLIATARACDPAQPLYVALLGCPTNLASALLLAPDIAQRIVVVWTSGYPSHAPHVNDSFNLEQDLLASQQLFDSAVPHVYLPGFQVGAQLRLSLPEIERHVLGRGAIGDYLHHLYQHNPLWPLQQPDASAPASWVIWDLINIAWLINPDWVPSTLVRSPRLGADRRWQADPRRHLMREAYGVQRDAIFQDFWRKLPG